VHRRHLARSDWTAASLGVWWAAGSVGLRDFQSRPYLDAFNLKNPTHTSSRIKTKIGLFLARCRHARGANNAEISASREELVRSASKLWDKDRAGVWENSGPVGLWTTRKPPAAAIGCSPRSAGPGCASDRCRRMASACPPAPADLKSAIESSMLPEAVRNANGGAHSGGAAWNVIR
jgi:hypothetical protein